MLLERGEVGVFIFNLPIQSATWLHRFHNFLLLINSISFQFELNSCKLYVIYRSIDWAVVPWKVKIIVFSMKIRWGRSVLSIFTNILLERWHSGIWSLEKKHFQTYTSTRCSLCWVLNFLHYNGILEKKCLSSFHDSQFDKISCILNVNQFDESQRQYKNLFHCN